jgi:hypothetical protein
VGGERGLVEGKGHVRPRSAAGFQSVL